MIKYWGGWKSKGLSDEKISPSTTSDNSLNPGLSYYGTKTRVKFIGGCLQQNKITFTHGKIVNIYIFFETLTADSNNNYPTLENALFGAVSLTKNADINKYWYSGYVIRFDRRGLFSFPSGGFRGNVIIFGVDMSFSARIDNKKKTF